MSGENRTGFRPGCPLEPNAALQPLRGEKPQLGGPAEPASRECQPVDKVGQAEEPGMSSRGVNIGSLSHPTLPGANLAQHRNRECLGASGFGAGGGSHEVPAAGAEPSFGSIQQLLMVADPTGSAFQGNKTLAAQLFGVFGAQS